jgi:hypothetical protein
MLRNDFRVYYKLYIKKLLSKLYTWMKTSLQLQKHNRILNVLGAVISLLGIMQLTNYCS